MEIKSIKLRKEFRGNSVDLRGGYHLYLFADI